MAKRHKYLEFGKAEIAQWCNGSGDCQNAPAQWSLGLLGTGATYFARCAIHKYQYDGLEVFNSLDDVKAHIAMREL